MTERTFQSEFDDRKWSLGNLLPSSPIETVPAVLDQLITSREHSQVHPSEYVAAMVARGFTEDTAVSAVTEHIELGSVALSDTYMLKLPARRETAA
ncbi:MAG TPA: hypothetical protein VFH39_00860 [Candidatus Saccharimonadales bacterium]|nr:hypothetical protein [Candidatus Saccharimonadales bacterium]